MVNDAGVARKDEWNGLIPGEIPNPDGIVVGGREELGFFSVQKDLEDVEVVAFQDPIEPLTVFLDEVLSLDFVGILFEVMILHSIR